MNDESKTKIKKEIEREIEKEIDDIWGKELELFQTKIDNAHKELDKKFEKFTKEISEKIKKIKIEQFIPNGKDYNLNLEYIDNTNYLINPILICLCNIDLFIYLCLENWNINVIKDLNDKEDILFSGFTNLISKIYLRKKHNYRDPFEIHKQLKIEMKNDFYTNDPGVIINFILKKLHNELNPFKQYSEDKFDDKKGFTDMITNNKTKISEEFFNILYFREECYECNSVKNYYQQIPIFDLYIDNDSALENVIINFKSVCKQCKKRTKNTIISLTSNILIININRKDDIINSKNIIYKLKLDLFNQKYELISVIRKDYFINDKVIIYDPENISVFCKNCYDNRWYSYNDENKKLIENENEIINGKKALLLIYKKI